MKTLVPGSLPPQNRNGSNKTIHVESIPEEQRFFAEREIQLIEHRDGDTRLVSSVPCIPESFDSTRIKDWITDGAVVRKSFLHANRRYARRNGASAPVTAKQNGNRLSYTAAEVAQLHGVSVKTVYRWIDRGLLSTSKASRKLLIPAHEVDNFMEVTI